MVNRGSIFWFAFPFIASVDLMPTAAAARSTVLQRDRNERFSGRHSDPTDDSWPRPTLRVATAL